MSKLRRSSTWLLRQRYPLILVGIALVLSLPWLFVGVHADDIMIRAAVLDMLPLQGRYNSEWSPFTFFNGAPEQNRAMMDSGLAPWWTDPACKVSFMRPFAALTHIIDYRWLADRPILMHLQSVAWFAALVWAAAVLYRRLLGRHGPAWFGALAALLFTLDDAHAISVGWLANRNALLAGVFGVLALIAHDRWRRDGWKPGALMGPLLFSIALLAKEEAACVAAYLFAYAIFLDRGSIVRRVGSLVPYVIVGAAWIAIYKYSGHGVIASGVYVDPLRHPAEFLARFAANAPLLLLGQWGFPMSDVSLALSAEGLRLHLAWAFVYLAYVFVVMWPLVRRDALARFWTLGMMLSIVPVCGVFPNDRLLMFAGLGAMGLLAQFIGGMKDGLEWVPKSKAWQHAGGFFIGLSIIVHLMVAPALFVGTAHLTAKLGDRLEARYATLPSDESFAGQTAVFVNAPSALMDMLMMQARHYAGRPVPRYGLNLCSTATSATMERVDDKTLVVRPAGGYLPPRSWSPISPPPMYAVSYHTRHLDHWVRGDENPLRLGDRVALSFVTIEITAMTPDDRPAEATFSFARSLDDPSLRWLVLTDGGYQPFRVPAIGERVEVPLPPE